MSNSLLFSIVDQINSPKSQAGRVWRINLISGSISVGDVICLHAVNINGNRKLFGYVNATVKQIQKQYGIDEYIFVDKAEQEIVTINIKDCYFEGKKINKNEINTNKKSIGVAAGSECVCVKSIKLRFTDEEAIYDFSEKRESALLWFGKAVSVEVKEKTVFETTDNFVTDIEFVLRNGHELSIPIDKNLRQYLSKFLIRRNASSNSFEWKYYIGELLWDNLIN